jgi:16S rRNA (guanine(527)-N(7))-methyltransferase RsmG
MDNLFVIFEKFSLWRELVDNFSLTLNMQQKLMIYIDFLLKENKKYDLTAHTTIESVLSYHIQDSLWAAKKIDWSNINSVVDIGSGCGIPGIILAIIFPKKTFHLMEILKKRIGFLNQAIELLNLTNCFVIEQDFKSFVRKGSIKVDLFCARASLPVEELIYIYGGASHYQKTQIIYWASASWEPTEQITKKCSLQKYEYAIEDRQRFYVLLAGEKAKNY